MWGLTFPHPIHIHRQLHGKLTRLEKGKLRNQTEEAVQSAKDVLSQVSPCLTMRVLMCG